jgi:hypothetical protein
MVKVLAGPTTDSLTNPLGRPALPETLVALRRPRAAIRRQDGCTFLTDQDGLVILSKSMFLKKLRLQWRYLLDPKQILDLSFFFECPISHDKDRLANTKNRLVSLGPFACTCWKYMSEIDCLFPSNVGHMYIAERANLPVNLK